MAGGGAVTCQFDERLRAVVLHLKALNRVESAAFRIETGTTTLQKRQWAEWFVSSKATVFLLLYNLVESTVREEMGEFYSAVQKRQCSVTELQLELLSTWVNQRYQSAAKQTATLETFRNTGLELAKAVVDGIPATFQVKNLGVGGNYDDSRIRFICREHSIVFPTPGKSVNGSALNTIKKCRNDLAHGTMTFEEVGRDYTLQQLADLKEGAEKFLRAFRTSVRHSIRYRYFQRIQFRR